MKTNSNDKSTGVRVLFTGQYWPGANSLYIARAFERCGAIVRILNDDQIFPSWMDILGKVIRRFLMRPVIEAEWNRQLLTTVARFHPDLVYITQANLCWSKTVEAIRRQNIPVMCLYHDVIWNSSSKGRFSENITLFDLVATTRSWHEPEFKAAGAKAVMVIRFGYEPMVHLPVMIEPHVVEHYGSDVTFIGSQENHRTQQLEALVATGFPYSFRLWGGGWERLSTDSPLRPYWQKISVYESEIRVIYASSKIALHWVGWEPHGTDQALKKGDQHNSRTFQIAACGGAMMLAQRTDEHRQFFTEDVEAVYFDDVDELCTKLHYWLDPVRDAERKAVAAAARARCIAEDYSYVPVVRQFLDFFGLPVVYGDV